MTTAEVVDPAVVERQNRLFDLYNSWPGDPDDDPDFVARAREIMGLAPLGDTSKPGRDEQTRSLDTSGEDMDETELDEIEELDDEETDDGEEEPGEPLDAAAARRALDDGSLRLRGILETRLAGKDVTPGNDQLHHYWTRGEGREKWVHSPKPWTTLAALLARHPEVGPERAKVFASRWFIEVFGYAAGSDLNRVKHGKPPRGHRVGPG